MDTKPFDKQQQQSSTKKPVVQSNNLSISNAMNRHKRQLSTGMQGVQVKGEAVGSPLLENIDPDEDGK